MKPVCVTIVKPEDTGPSSAVVTKPCWINPDNIEHIFDVEGEGPLGAKSAIVFVSAGVLFAAEKPSAICDMIDVARRMK